MTQEILVQSQFERIPGLQEEWLRIKHLIEKALEYDELYEIKDVEYKIGNGTFLLWTGKQSAMVTEFQEFPNKKICNLLFCGGNFEELVQITNTVEDYCKICGVNKIFGGGRPGWLKKIKHLGWKNEYLISKEL